MTIRKFTLLLAAASLIACALPAAADYQAHVEEVIDGDTIVVKGATGAAQKIRLAAIDAPELGQLKGPESAQALRKAILGKQVRVRNAGSIGSFVFYDGKDQGLAQIERGCAWYSRTGKKALSEADQFRYDAAERGAHAAGRGFWASMSSTLEPWEWRRQQQAKLAAANAAAKPESKGRMRLSRRAAKPAGAAKPSPAVARTAARPAPRKSARVSAPAAEARVADRKAAARAQAQRARKASQGKKQARPARKPAARQDAVSKILKSRP